MTNPTAQIIDLDLAREANFINELHARYSAAEKTTLAVAIEIGHHLIAVKASLKHGEFMPWVAANCTFKGTQCLRYMQAAKSTLRADLHKNEAPAPTTICEVAKRGARPPAAKASVSADPTRRPWLEAAERRMGGLPVGFPRDRLYRKGDERGGLRRTVEGHLGHTLPEAVEVGSAEEAAIVVALQKTWTEIRPAVEYETLLEQVPENKRDRFERVLTEARAELQRRWSDELRNGIEAGVAAKLTDARARLEQATEERDIEKQRYSDLSARLDRWMTQDEFRLVAGCLHSDRQTEQERERYDRAFAIFRRLQVHVHTWAANRKANGWPGGRWKYTP